MLDRDQRGGARTIEPPSACKPVAFDRSKSKRPVLVQLQRSHLQRSLVKIALCTRRRGGGGGGGGGRRGGGGEGGRSGVGGRGVEGVVASGEEEAEEEGGKEEEEGRGGGEGGCLYSWSSSRGMPAL